MDQQSGLIAATAGWLVQLTTGSPDLLPAGPVTSPAPALTGVPEFVLENLCEHLLLVKRFNPVHFEQIGPKLGSLLMVILCYIDQPGLVSALLLVFCNCICVVYNLPSLCFLLSFLGHERNPLNI